MTWVALLLIAALLAAFVWHQLKEPPQPPLDPEEVTRAEIELHRIGRRLDVARLKHEQRSDAARARREISDALNSEDDD